ncbi:MAG TPA: multicopper oxidase domain-containing protein [Gemmatimonadales bacterium]|nr:multicopper oxidase domain-containing protein [Gemmatimonadales bacterium]
MRYAAFLLSFMLALPVHAQSPSSGTTRNYYIAADEVVWDYAPLGKNAIAGRPFRGIEEMWTKRGPTQIGAKYKKAIYREYTDSSFKTLKPRSADWEHLGMMEPVIRAEVGDSIRVVFRNNGSYPFSMHPHGVFYDKNSEGAIYEDDTSGGDKADDGVPPGKTFTYIWVARERAGPSPGEPSSSLWMYHSHVDEARDVNAGLIGPLIVTARGKARPDGSPTDVDREIVMAFAEMDENLSWYIDDNIKSYALQPAKVRKVRGPSFIDPFGVTNLKATMNGFIYGNGPSPAMNVGDRVRWYIMSTTNFELHAPHWHGNVVTAQHMRTDVLNLGTMGMIVADMTADNPGNWLFHCHIEPHMTAGMAARFTVGPAVASVGMED